MINTLDKALRQLLIREIPVRNGEVDITFEQPRREWSTRLNRPTINLFLFDMHENKKLRQAQPVWEVQRGQNNTAVKRRRPVRMNLRYLITAWAGGPEDEHHLLARTALAFFRHPHLAEEFLPDPLKNQDPPISVVVGQQEDFGNPADFWGAMDNELRPGLACVITLALDPYQPLVEPLVLTRELRFGPFREPPLAALVETAPTDSFWTIGGTIRGDHSPEELQLTLEERSLKVPVQPDGRFKVGNLQAGDYTLVVSVGGRETRRHQITVPATDYELEL